MRGRIAGVRAIGKTHSGAGHFSRLNNAERLSELRPLQLLKEVAGVTPGMTCVDLGSGTGAFALPMAEIVGRAGRVYAVDNDKDMLDYIATQDPGPQLVLVQADMARTGLESETANVCLAAFVLHEVASPETVLAEAFRLLKAGGLIAIAEWRMESRIGPPASVKISGEKARELLNLAGFEFESYRDWSINHYVVTARKPSRESTGKFVS